MEVGGGLKEKEVFRLKFTPYEKAWWRVEAARLREELATLTAPLEPEFARSGAIPPIDIG